MDYEVAHTAVAQAAELGLEGTRQQLRELLAGFALKSAIITHPLGTRRYGGYVLDIEEGRVYGIYKLHEGAVVCHDCHGTRRHHMHDQDTGWVEVPCQSCKEGWE
jgi:hypothetical protein